MLTQLSFCPLPRVELLPASCFPLLCPLHVKYALLHNSFNLQQLQIQIDLTLSAGNNMYDFARLILLLFAFIKNNGKLN